MTSEDTIELLQECDAGIKMGMSSLEQVVDKTSNEKLRGIIQENKDAHEKLQEELHQLLAKAGCESGVPNPMAQGMSWLKTSMMTAMDDSHETIADILTDGCDMGVKSLRKYLNQYENASDESRDICERIITTEEDLRNKLKEFL